MAKFKYTVLGFLAALAIMLLTGMGPGGEVGRYQIGSWASEEYTFATYVIDTKTGSVKLLDGFSIAKDRFGKPFDELTPYPTTK